MKTLYSFKVTIINSVLFSILTFQFLNVSSQGTPGSVLFVHADLSLIHISEPTRPLYISYAVFCLKK